MLRTGLANTTRSSIDAISRGVLPDAGMSFEIPKITTMPTVAETAEAGALPALGYNERANRRQK